MRIKAGGNNAVTQIVRPVGVALVTQKKIEPSVTGPVATIGASHQMLIDKGFAINPIDPIQPMERDHHAPAYHRRLTQRGEPDIAGYAYSASLPNSIARGTPTLANLGKDDADVLYNEYEPKMRQAIETLSEGDVKLAAAFQEHYRLGAFFTFLDDVRQERPVSRQAIAKADDTLFGISELRDALVQFKSDPAKVPATVVNSAYEIISLIEVFQESLLEKAVSPSPSQRR